MKAPDNGVLEPIGTLSIAEEPPPEAIKLVKEAEDGVELPIAVSSMLPPSMSTLLEENEPALKALDTAT